MQTKITYKAFILERYLIYFFKKYWKMYVFSLGIWSTGLSTFSQVLIVWTRGIVRIYKWNVFSLSFNLMVTKIVESIKLIFEVDKFGWKQLLQTLRAKRFLKENKLLAQIFFQNLECFTGKDLFRYWSLCCWCKDIGGLKLVSNMSSFGYDSFIWKAQHDVTYIVAWILLTSKICGTITHNPCYLDLGGVFLGPSAQSRAHIEGLKDSVYM